MNKTTYNHLQLFDNLQKYVYCLLSSNQDIKSDDIIYIFAMMTDIIEILKDDNHDDDNDIVSYYIEQLTGIIQNFIGSLINAARCDVAVLFINLLKNKRVVGNDFVLDTKQVNSIEEKAQCECYNKYRAKLVFNSS